MRYKFYLDDIQVTEPIGSEGLVTTIKRDKIVNGILTTQDATLTFIEDGYDYLLDLLNNESFCSSAEIRIMISQDEGQNYSEYFKGIIFISDVRFIEDKGYAKAKIQDNSFDAKINNNKNIEALPNVGRSKNDITITAAPSVTVELFDVATGTPIAITGGVGNEAQGRAYRVYDLFRFYVDFMTDGEIAFDSTLFGVGGTYEGLVITSGYMVKGYNGVTPEDEFYSTFPKLSYNKIFTELKKKLNLSFIIESASTTPTIRIESSSYLNEPSTELLVIDDVDSIETYISQGDIYSSVKFGCGGLIDAVAYNFPETIVFLGFNEEQFHTIGTCNIDNTLDLSGEFICSSNAIEEAIDMAGLSDMSDDAVVLINSTALVSGTSYEATATNWLDSSIVRYYNEALTNKNVCLNYFGYIPNSIAFYLNTSDNTFTAQKAQPDPFFYYTGLQPQLLITCPVVLADPNTNYTSPYYIAPTTGTYTFLGSINVLLQNGSGTAIVYNDLSIILKRTDGAGAFISDTIIPVVTTQVNPTQSIQVAVVGSGTILMNATDRCYLYFGIDGFLVAYKILAMSQFGCTGTSSTGGIYQTYDADNYSVLRHEMNYPLSFDDFSLLKANPKGVIKFKSDGSPYRRGLIENIRYGVSSSKLTLFSSRNLNK